MKSPAPWIRRYGAPRIRSLFVSARSLPRHAWLKLNHHGIVYQPHIATDRGGIGFVWLCAFAGRNALGDITIGCRAVTAESDCNLHTFGRENVVPLVDPTPERLLDNHVVAQ